MTRDTRFYPDPEDFRPERFIVPDEQKDELLMPSSFVFGFGRRSAVYAVSSFPHRVCPGQALADPSLWLAMANIVALFDIKKAVDKAGHEISPPIVFQPGFTRLVHTHT
ncbi:hypothetical protein TRAPUB_12378 [Trametes pubescens]|uniref:Cytochrome P450 n=1 Tax=Trametes pubescens TaxID=154538 RepID=A0A1M2VU09_TRAPU|nr:hypothetical protein TRAPUB_12378 [Trametes pubescens]